MQMGDRRSPEQNTLVKPKQKATLKMFRQLQRRKGRLSSCILLVIVIVLFTYVHRRKISTTRQSLRCNLPTLDPWDESVREYITEWKGFNCSKGFEFFFVDEGGYLQANQTILEFYKMTPLECVYHVVSRVDDFNISVENGIPFKVPIFIPSRVFIVVCSDSTGKTVYRYVHLNVMFNEDKRREREIGFESDENLSVVIIGFDSVSRSQALRSLPKTYDYLVQKLGAFDFKGLVKVGLNTFPNTMPFLSGKPHAYFHRQTKALDYFDNMPFIWSEEPMRSYVLHYNEDRPDNNLLTYERLGFKKNEFDYNHQIYAVAMKDTEPVILDPLGRSTWACYGNKQHVDLQLEHFKRFTKKYSRKLKFTFFWNNEISHDNFNGLRQVDETMLQLLRWLKTNGHLDRTLMFFGSDHGFRSGGFAKTDVGRIENNMPFMTMYVPEHLLHKYPWIRKNLKYNANSLITHFDLHETMKQVVYGNFIRAEYPKVQPFLVRRSLFEKIPETRNCADAGIQENFCVCQEMFDIVTSDPIVNTLARQCVDHINTIIKQNDDANLCRPLEFREVFAAKWRPLLDSDSLTVYGHTYYGKIESRYGRYIVLFYTTPNDGLFEMMLDLIKADNTDEIKVIGDPGRVNSYGNQSLCVHGHLMRQICLCRW